MNNNITIIDFTREEQNNSVISYWVYETYYGTTLVASTEKGVCYIGFGNIDERLEMMQKHYPNAKLINEQKTEWHNIALHYIDNVEDAHLVLHINGTIFQMSVWRALLEIPFGELSTYKLIADAVNNPKAVRAVGTAVGQNPVSYIIPCHRVIRSDGGLGGYSSGLDYKKKMLDKEKSLI